MITANSTQKEKLVYILKQVEHELTTTNNLYVADNAEFKESFRIDFTKVIANVEKAIDFLCENKPIESMEIDKIQYKKIN